MAHDNSEHFGSWVNFFYRTTSVVGEEGHAQAIFDYFRFRDYVLRVPTSSGHINMPSEGFVSITSEHTCGFYLPIHPIIRERLATVSLSLVQLSPISYSLLTSTYILYAKRLNGPLHVMSYYFCTRFVRILLDAMGSSMFKLLNPFSRFFLVRLKDVTCLSS